MRKLLKRLARDESGISAIEFALVITILSIAIISHLYSLRDFLNGFFGDASSRLN